MGEVEHHADANGFCPVCTRLGVGNWGGPAPFPCGALLVAEHLQRQAARPPMTDFTGEWSITVLRRPADQTTERGGRRRPAARNRATGTGDGPPS